MLEQQKRIKISHWRIHTFSTENKLELFIKRCIFMKWKISAKRDMCAKSLQSCPTLCDPMDPAPVSTGLSRQEHCSGSPCPPPGDLPDPGTNLRPSVSCRAGRLVTTSATWRPRHVSTLESCFFLAVQGLRSRTALTRNQAHALRWKP